MMDLKRLTEHIWYMPFEEERDRPNLGYVKGDHWSLAIDAGHSAAHVKEFYTLLEREKLPLPGMTVLTHWHWDHTFGMHAVNGLTLANDRTNGYLAEWKDKIEKNGPEEFLAIHESIRREYGTDTEVIVKKIPPWSMLRTTKRSSLAIPPATISLPGSRGRIFAGSWRIPSGGSIPKYVWKAIGFPQIRRIRWQT